MLFRSAGEMPFEHAIAELETIVDQMESGEMPLEESLKRYQRGVELVKAAHAKLKAVSQQVKMLEDGVLKPLNLGEDE